MTLTKQDASIIRATTSVCPQCLGEIPAQVIERDGAVYFRKRCEVHGGFEIEVSRNPADYRYLSKAYFYFLQSPMPPAEYYLCATTACNADCPICFLKQCPEQLDGLSLKEVERIAADKSVKRFTFSHGEATTCPELPAMIGILKQHGKIVNIHTNGIKAADPEYAAQLKRAGIDQVSLQFDAFSRKKSVDLRGDGSLDRQLRALENLKELKIPVTLNVTIAKGVNEDEVGVIFDHAVKEGFIKDLSFITYCHYDRAKGDNFGRYMMPDELITCIEAHSKGRIARPQVVFFQKLFYAYMHVAGIRKCFNYFHYPVVRWNGGYLPVSDFINLKKAAAWLDRLEDNKKGLTVFTFFGVVLSSLRLRSLLLLPWGLLMLLRRGYPQASGNFLMVTFATICDPYKYDPAIAVNCGQGIIIKDKAHDSYGTYLMQEMSRKRQAS